MEVFARGVRNSVGFDWDPRRRSCGSPTTAATCSATTSARRAQPRAQDRHALRLSVCHGGDIADPEFGSKRNCSEFTPPAKKFGAHVASLGMRFYTGSMFPAEYRNRIFIARARLVEPPRRRAVTA